MQNSEETMITNREDLRQQGEMFFSEMPEGLLQHLKHLSESLGYSLAQVATNLLIDQMARACVPTYRERKLIPRAYPEFMLEDGELVTGERLFHHLVRFHAADEQRRESAAIQSEPKDEALEEIRRLIAKGFREGRDIQIGEKECWKCGAELDPPYDLKIQAPGKPALILRCCKDCAYALDFEEGIFKLVRGQSGEKAAVREVK